MNKQDIACYQTIKSWLGVVLHKEKSKNGSKEKTVQDVLDSMTEEQKEVLYLLVGAVYEEAKRVGR